MDQKITLSFQRDELDQFRSVSGVFWRLRRGGRRKEARSAQARAMACGQDGGRIAPMGDAQRVGSWSEDNSRQFIDYGRYFVPERERQIGIIGELIPEPPVGALLVELCSGE